MASEVDICNLALGHLGDNATVASLDPPEGSAQAEHCARFYALARDSILELHDWNFATKRSQPAMIAASWPQWRYAYVQPADCLRVVSVLNPEATDDFSQSLPRPWSQSGIDGPAMGNYTPQPYVCETDDEGREIILTNQEYALVRYVAFVSDTTRFTPLFITTLTWHLASLLAGPVIKGDTGRAEGKRCEGMAAMWLGKAVNSDSAQRRVTPVHSVGWMAGR
jgi:hypothetical protein